MGIKFNYRKIYKKLNEPRIIFWLVIIDLFIFYLQPKGTAGFFNSPGVQNIGNIFDKILSYINL